MSKELICRDQMEFLNEHLHFVASVPLTGKLQVSLLIIWVNFRIPRRQPDVLVLSYEDSC